MKRITGFWLILFFCICGKFEDFKQWILPTRLLNDSSNIIKLWFKSQQCFFLVSNNENVWWKTLESMAKLEETQLRVGVNCCCCLLPSGGWICARRPNSLKTKLYGTLWTDIAIFFIAILSYLTKKYIDVFPHWKEIVSSHVEHMLHAHTTFAEPLR